ncbi:hypothetical protein CAEBREN_06288 [Caenorhabditis brenneri]|uniref:Uncharacterized protein n=1 Tax=Caenorhabditis brenneri TaxID=135651 RepID=G0MC86_CAEBE|nr:hypothetical protein CAEBREN_06288 [Caenorhabditis brenneri]
MILWKCSLSLLLLSIWTVNGSDYEAFMKHIQSQVVPYINKSVDLNSGTTAIVQVFQWHQIPGQMVIEELKWTTKRMEVYMKHRGISQGLAFVIRGQGKDISLHTRDLVTGQSRTYQALAPNYHVAGLLYFTEQYELLNSHTVTLKNGETGEEVKYDTVISYVQPSDVSFRKMLYSSFASMIDKSIDLYSGKTAIVQVFQWQMFSNRSFVSEELRWHPTRMDVYVRDGSPYQGLAFVIRGQGDNIGFYKKDIATGQVMESHTYAPTYRVASFGYLIPGAAYLNDFKLTLKNGETGEEIAYDTVFHYVELKDQTTTVATTTTTVAPTTTTTLSSEEVSFRKNLMELIDSKVDKSIDLYSGNTSFVNVFHWQTYENQPYFVLEEYKLVKYQRLDVYVKEGCASQGLAFVFRGQGNKFRLGTWNHLTNKPINLPTYLPTYHVASIDYLKHSAYFYNSTENNIYLKNQETEEGDEIWVHFIRPEDQTTTVAPTTTTTLSSEEASFQCKLVKYQRLDVYVKEGCASQGLAFVFRGQGNNFSLWTRSYLTNEKFIELPTYLPTYHAASIDYMNHSYNSTKFYHLTNEETQKSAQIWVHYIRPEDQTTTIASTDSSSEILGFPLSSIEGMIAPLISKSIDLHSGKTNIRQIMQWDKSEDGTLSFKQIMWQVTEITVFVKRNITDQGLAFVIQGTGDRFSVTLKSEETGAETTREANLLENRVVMIPFGENGQKMIDETLRFTVENLGTGMKHTYQQVIRLARKSFIHSD